MPKMPKRNPQLWKNVIISVLILVVFGAFLSLYSADLNQKEEIGLGTMIEKIEQGEVKSIEVKNQQELEITLNDDSVVYSRKEPSESLSTLLDNYGVDKSVLNAVSIDVKNTTSGAAYWAGALLPIMIPVLLIGAILFFMMRQVQGGNNRAMMFGQSKAKQMNPGETKNRILFADVAGSKEPKEELKEVVEFLKQPKKFQALGAKVPRGVLLMGPPGTGKTLLARAVAGEANVPFFHISGSEFVEMFVGVGASRVRDLFRKAQKAAPAIVFIDEIDAVGRQRGTGLGGSHDEREQTLNQILVQMDGFDNDTNVIVIAATNRPDVLDPALLRPGRFDRRVTIDLPDIKERAAILKTHAKNKPIEEVVNLRTIAERTPGFSGADLESVLNESAILAARQDKKKVDERMIIDSIEKVLMGPERKSKVVSAKERKIVAYHESGHALVGHILPESDPIRKVTIVPRGRAGGYTLNLPVEDRSLKSRAEFLDDMAMMMGGRVAEQIVFGEITTGASDDLVKATKVAKDFVTRYGMSEALGTRTYGERDEMVFLGKEISEQRDYSDETANRIDDEIDRLLAEAKAKAEKVIHEKREYLEKIANTLLEQETLEQHEFLAIFGETPKSIEKDEEESSDSEGSTVEAVDAKEEDPETGPVTAPAAA